MQLYYRYSRNGTFSYCSTNQTAQYKKRVPLGRCCYAGTVSFPPPIAKHENNTVTLETAHSRTVVQNQRQNIVKQPAYSSADRQACNNTVTLETAHSRTVVQQKRQNVVIQRTATLGKHCYGSDSSANRQPFNNTVTLQTAHSRKQEKRYIRNDTLVAWYKTTVVTQKKTVEACRAPLCCSGSYPFASCHQI